MTAYLRARRDRIAVLAALLAPPATCAALVPARSGFPNTDAALVLVALIVAVAANGSRAAGLLAALSAAVWFDFFLTVPYERLTITHRTDVQTTLLLLAVGAAVTELAALARRRGRVASTDEALLAVVQSSAALVARGAPAQLVLGQVNVQLTALLAARRCRFQPGDARGRGLRIQADGSVAWGSAPWKLAEHGFPDEPVELPARHAGRTLGRFVLDATAGTAPSLEARRVAVVLADLAAAAIDHDNTHNPRP